MKSRKITMLFVALLFISWSSNAQKNREQQDAATSQWKYDIECYGGTARN